MSINGKNAHKKWQISDLVTFCMWIFNIYAHVGKVSSTVGHPTHNCCFCLFFLNKNCFYLDANFFWQLKRVGFSDTPSNFTSAPGTSQMNAQMKLSACMSDPRHIQQRQLLSNKQLHNPTAVMSVEQRTKCKKKIGNQSLFSL